MLLAINIDNKITNFGVFDNNNMIDSFSIMTDTNRSISEIRVSIKLILADKNIDLDEINEIIISSVVPELIEVYEEISESIVHKKPISISSGVKTGLNIKCENPKEVGSDRIIRAVGAKTLYDDDNNIIIISAASITTIDFINSKKEFLGGAILPGINLFESSLHNQSAKLPQVEIRSVNNILGKNTISAIQSGIYHGYRSSVFGILKKIIEDYKLENDDTNIIMTGEFNKLLDDKNYSLKFVENLDLLGLNYIYKLNNR